MDIREIAKEILLKIIEHDGVIRSEFPESETYIDAACEAYKKILKTLKES
jgi:hypothetical protein